MNEKNLSTIMLIYINKTLMVFLLITTMVIFLLPLVVILLLQEKFNLRKTFKLLKDIYFEQNNF